jgi:molybdopterin-guanine dinucleotide biosynthesis protein A
MGRPKALLTLPDGRTLIEHVAGVALSLGERFTDVVILGRPPSLPASLASLPLVADEVSGAGPLAGLCSLLEYAMGRWGLLLACDMPCLDAPVLLRLLDRADAAIDAVIFSRPSRPGAYHACCGLYHPRVRPAAVEELKHGSGSLHNLLARVRVAALSPTADESRQLTNVNTPDEFAEAGQQA